MPTGWFLSAATTSQTVPRRSLLPPIWRGGLGCVCHRHPRFGKDPGAVGSHRRRVGDGATTAGVRPPGGPVRRAGDVRHGYRGVGAGRIPGFTLFDTRNIAWFAVGMNVAFGVIHAWFYGAQGTLYASLFPTRIRYTGHSTIYQVSGIYASDLTPLIRASLIAADTATRGMRAAIWLRLWCSAWVRGYCSSRSGPRIRPEPARPPRHVEWPGNRPASVPRTYSGHRAIAATGSGLCASASLTAGRGLLGPHRCNRSV
jgi:hypothetical protein